jgi:hypothetical protein
MGCNQIYFCYVTLTRQQNSKPIKVFMKRLFVTLTLALGLISLSSFASDDYKVSDAAVKSFNSSFRTASEVSWTVTGDIYKASFLLNGQYVSAYFNAEGQ